MMIWRWRRRGTRSRTLWMDGGWFEGPGFARKNVKIRGNGYRNSHTNDSRSNNKGCRTPTITTVVEVGSLSHFLKRFYTSSVVQDSSINSITTTKTIAMTLWLCTTTTPPVFLFFLHAWIIGRRVVCVVLYILHFMSLIVCHWMVNPWITNSIGISINQ